MGEPRHILSQITFQKTCQVKIDNELYYVDTFSFMTNSLEFNSYKEFMTKGELIYA